MFRLNDSLQVRRQLHARAPTLRFLGPQSYPPQKRPKTGTQNNQKRTKKLHKTTQKGTQNVKKRYTKRPKKYTKRPKKGTQNNQKKVHKTTKKVHKTTKKGTQNNQKRYTKRPKKVTQGITIIQRPVRAASSGDPSVTLTAGFLAKAVLLLPFRPNASAPFPLPLPRGFTAPLPRASFMLGTVGAPSANGGAASCKKDPSSNKRFY